ncbi:MAG TPA: S8 family serine peptidase, partial [Puia sp.]
MIGFLPQLLSAQQTNITDFVLFGGSSSCATCAVTLGSATAITGSIGSYHIVQSTGNASVTGNMYSGGTVKLSNGNTVTGRITAANIPAVTGTILSAGTSSLLKGNIDVNGNIVVGGGTVSARVTHPAGTTYSGPAPTLGNVTGNPSLPTLPSMPSVTTFPVAGTANITATKTITPGAYNTMTLSGKQTITFSGPGIYIFNSIKNTGNTNIFLFDFKKLPGDIKIYVYGDIDLNDCGVDTLNGGGASRIYTETHGTGSTSAYGPYSWNLTSGSNQSYKTKWVGTVWAPFGGISIGEGNQAVATVGAFYSATMVNIGGNSSVNYAPYKFCITPNANAGADKQLTCAASNGQLNGSSTTPGATFKWTALNGGNIVSGGNTATPLVSAAGTYVLTVTDPNGGCTATDTTLVTSVPCILPYYPPPTGGKSFDIIGSELGSLYDNFGMVTDSAKTIFIINGGTVQIEVIARAGQYQTLLALLQTSPYGLTNLVNNGPNTLIITGTYPIVNLKKLDSLPNLIDYCRPMFPPLGNSSILPIQGDTVMRTNFVRQGYNIAGNGIKVGVLSDSYNTLTGTSAQADIVNGILPGAANNPDSNFTPVKVLSEYPYGRASDEGRAMLQVVHGIAPKAKLDFRTGFISAGDFAQGILQLQQDSCQVIVDDVTYITEPFFQDGVVAQAANLVAGQGVSYFSAAGNNGNSSYGSNYNPAPAPNGITGTAHNFGGSIYQSISLTPGTYTIVLQWQDSIYSLGQTTTGTVNDLDIYLTDTTGRTLFGFNRNNIGGDPLEVLPFTVTANSTTHIMIIRSAGSGNIPFKYVVFRGNLTINNFNAGVSTIVGHSNATGVMSVGAARYTQTPAYGVSPFQMETFSSYGGTPINGVLRNKPDFVAPDGVSTTVNFGSINITGSPFPSFFGTSCAAPQAAGVAALLLEGKLKYSNVKLSPAQMRSLLQSTARQNGPPGYNVVTGYGLIQADTAMKTFADPTPVITKLI